MQGISGSSGTMLDTAALAARRAQMFAKADSDGNGKMTLAEFKSAAPTGGPPPGGPPGGGGAQGPGGGNGVNGAGRANGPSPGGGKPKLDQEQMFAAMDTDQDGSVSSEESAAFEPKMASGTMSAMLSLQDTEETVKSSSLSTKAATMTDLMSQLQKVLESSAKRTNDSKGYAISA